jgi:hypothetical protein
MTSLTIHLPEELKHQLQKKIKMQGVTFTFIINQALQAYNEDKIKFGLISSDDEVTASFDVSTKNGKKDCLKSFKALCKK